jgi:hypothetical protein
MLDGVIFLLKKLPPDPAPRCTNIINYNSLKQIINLFKSRLHIKYNLSGYSGPLISVNNKLYFPNNTELINNVRIIVRNSSNSSLFVLAK